MSNSGSNSLGRSRPISLKHLRARNRWVIPTTHPFLNAANKVINSHFKAYEKPDLISQQESPNKLYLAV